MSPKFSHWLDQRRATLGQQRVAFVRAFFRRLKLECAPTQAGLAPDGTFEVVWDIGREHVEVEFHVTTFDWFYVHLDTNTTEAGRHCIVRNFPGKLARRLRSMTTDVDPTVWAPLTELH